MAETGAPEAAKGSSDEPVETAAVEQSSENMPADQPDSAPGQPSTGGDTGAAEGAVAESTAPTPVDTDSRQTEASDVVSKGSGNLADHLKSKSEEVEGVVLASQEPGVAPTEDVPGKVAVSGHSEEQGPPDAATSQEGALNIETESTTVPSLSATGLAESDAVETETPAQGDDEGQDANPETGGVAGDDSARKQWGDADAGSCADQTSPAERGSVADVTVTAGAEEADSETSGRSSGEESGSDGSGGRSLTRLVERSSLEQQHRALLLLRRQLLARNQRVQQRLSQHFSRKTDDTAERVEKNVGELEARYTRYLSGIREQQRFTAEERERRQQELAAFRAQVERQTELVSAAYSAAVELRRQVALKSRSSRTGRLMSAAEVEALIGREQQKELEVQEARLESLRRETRLGRLEQTLRESEELAGGIHLIDFEQLKIENQTYAEKIEERNEDLTKLRRKISSTVQILTHLKERIQFEQAENERRQSHLRTVLTEVTHGREGLAQLKQRRDQVRSRTASQRATAGLLGHEPLLRDFETRVDEEGRLARELRALKREYGDQQRMSQAIRQTVRARRQQQQQGKPRTTDRH